MKDTETEERASRSKDSGKRPSGNVTEDEEDEDNVRAKPKVSPAHLSYIYTGGHTEWKSALASVLDFLGDQSDSD